MIDLRHAVVAIAVALAATACDKAPKGQDRAAPVPPPPGGVAMAADPTGWVELPADRPIGPTMAQHAAAAIKAGKKPFAYLHASWCDPCVQIQKTHATDPQMKDAFAGTYIMALDIDRVPEQQLIDQSLPFGVIPVFYRLDETGVPAGDSIDGGAWEADIPANMAPPLKAFFAK